MHRTIRITGITKTAARIRRDKSIPTISIAASFITISSFRLVASVYQKGPVASTNYPATFGCSGGFAPWPGRKGPQGPLKFLPEQPPAGLEQGPGADALAAQLEVHGQGLPHLAQGVPAGHGLPRLDVDAPQPVEVAAQAAAVVDHHRVAGQAQLLGHRHQTGRASCR